MIEVIKSYIQLNSIEILLLTLNVAVFVIGIIGNFLVCYVVYKCKALHSVTNFFIVNLAVADFVVLLICLPPTIVQTMFETWFFGEFMCKIIHGLQTISFCTSVLTLCAISIERYFGICRPMTPKMSKRKFILILAVIWIVAVLVALPSLIVMRLKIHFPDIPEYLSVCYRSWSMDTDIVYNTTLLFSLYFLPICILGICYTVISINLWKSRIPGTGEALSNSKSVLVNVFIGTCDVAGNQLQSRKNVAKMLMAIVILFIICYLPFNLLHVKCKYFRLLDMLDNQSYIRVIWLIAQWLCYFNSAMNPVIYNFMSARFRREFQIACCCLKEDESIYDRNRHTRTFRTEM
ncbi:hypothetical protein LOTGIDRAFT_120990 [Lottia gigantea]|uniref:G-protein coupled receptors family 1 profile domain-containing protein n=1 Tax=Lottia gigantea TaxID=225164 RepID=V3ZM64_LOTGI|nr:hypothetical protein LOTGIDRAFT_120990 [Lottia gigantea]ESO92448.1 hypothetical protein LOTGIDRAFT_120990 [Lottia gigantea]